MCPTLDKQGVDLLEKFLLYTPKDRISAKEALNHPYFNDLQKDSI
jgi:serine/threonine protein kinase